ncbi:hypothetical protein D1872_195040 [compost metagenome]
MEWKPIIPLLQQMEVHAQGENELVQVNRISSGFTCIGRGTDAAVFVHSDCPTYAFKLYAFGKDQKRKNEEKTYRKLRNNKYFPVFYEAGERYLVMSYEKGINLYECLTEGIEIPKTVVLAVDKAIAYARGVGLNPRDIHLKNIILQEEGIKVIDVSEYVKDGNDKRWEHLKEGYRLYYPLIASKKIPPSFIEFVKKQYAKRDTFGFCVQKFGRFLLPLFRKRRRKGVSTL